ncbi:MAG: DUF3098 domain-containing protein [Bacteroidota bacterium]|jgi:Protein of unknown function (DUF3098)
MDKNKKPVLSKKSVETAKASPVVKIGEFAFGKENYRLMLIGLAFIAVGFLLMIGGGSDNPKVFNYEIFSFRRITLSPILILAGYVIEIFAIMKKPKD